MGSRPFRSLLVVAVLFVTGFGGSPGDANTSGEEIGAMRPFDPAHRNAICYGPHRDGQRPGGAEPSAAELREDLALMLSHWNLLRIYGASGFAKTLLEVIRADDLDMQVMLGVWIERDEEEGNRRDTEAAIALANAYPDIVVAVCVGNETQISWAAHRCPPEVLIDAVRKVRAGVEVPVTVADDFNYWNKPESRAVAVEIDFVTMHAHPMWNGRQLDEGLDWFALQVEAVRAMHPGHRVVVGEIGWATSVHDQGEQAELIKGKPGEAEQKIFHEAVTAWAVDENVTVFWFEAFDENWKGGTHRNEVEKHWGLFRSDRSPKAAMAADRID